MAEWGEEADIRKLGQPAGGLRFFPAVVGRDGLRHQLQPADRERLMADVVGDFHVRFKFRAIGR